MIEKKIVSQKMKEFRIREFVSKELPKSCYSRLELKKTPLAEIVIGGRGVPSSRARSWRFLAGHLKKSGDISENHMKRAIAVAHLKSGSVGVKVSILTADIKLPDDIRFASDNKIEVEEIPVTEAQEIKQQEKIKEVPKEEAKEQIKKKKPKDEAVEEIVEENGGN